MKRTLAIVADGVDLMVTVEGQAPPGITNAIVKAARNAAANLIANALLTDEARMEEER